MSRPPAALEHLTEQPGPGHTVMAPRLSRGAEWVLARPLRPPTLREDPTPSTNQHQVVPAPDDAPPLVGVHLLRPRPLIPRGLRALQLDTSHTAASHGNDENDQHKQIARQPRLHPVRVAESFAHALLTRKALMGAADRATLPMSVL
jgi:hypothetical protein